MPTASGDAESYVDRFVEAFAGRAETSSLRLFHLAELAEAGAEVDLRAFVLAQARHLRRRRQHREPVGGVAPARPRRDPGRGRRAGRRPAGISAGMNCRSSRRSPIPSARSPGCRTGSASSRAAPARTTTARPSDVRRTSTWSGPARWRRGTPPRTAARCSSATASSWRRWRPAPTRAPSACTSPVTVWTCSTGWRRRTSPRACRRPLPGLRRRGECERAGASRRAPHVPGQAACCTDSWRRACCCRRAMAARRTLGPPVLIFQSIFSCDGAFLAVVVSSQPLGSESRMILCQALPTCRQRRLVVGQPVAAKRSFTCGATSAYRLLGRSGNRWCSTGGRGCRS